jgi:hypothetical protein
MPAESLLLLLLLLQQQWFCQAMAQLAAAADLLLPGRGFTPSMPAVLSRKAYSKAVSFRRSNLQRYNRGTHGVKMDAQRLHMQQYATLSVMWAGRA